MFILITQSLFNHINASNSIWLGQQARFGVYLRVRKDLVSASWQEMSQLRELVFDLPN